MSAPMYETDRIETAGVTNHAMYINPAFFNPLKLVDQAQILAHEVLHLALEHRRRRRWRDKMKWNIAADVVINYMIERQGFKMLPDCATVYKFFSDHDQIDMDAMNAETIYSMLPELHEIQGILGDSMPSESEFLDGQDENNEERVNWEFQLRSAAKHARLTYGNMPGWIERSIGITSPRLSWEVMISHFVSSVVDQERTYRRLDKRHLWRDAILPKSTSYSTRLAIVIDASGSITNKMLSYFVAEINNLSLTLNKPFVLFVHDTVVTLAEVVEPGRCSITSIKGGGGTDFRPVIEKLEMIAPDGVIWMTDGYGYYPDTEPQFPILWVLTKRHMEPPFGWKTMMEES